MTQSFSLIWAPRIGVLAAEKAFWAMRVSIMTRLGIYAGTLLFILAEWSGDPAAMGIAPALMLLVLALLVIYFWWPIQLSKAISQYIGIKVPWRMTETILRNPDRFDRWVEARREGLDGLEAQKAAGVPIIRIGRSKNRP